MHACVIHVHSVAECVCMHVLCTCVVCSMLCAYVHELVCWRVYMCGCMRPVHVWLVAWLSIIQYKLLPPFINISLSRDLTMSYIRMYINIV